MERYGTTVGGEGPRATTVVWNGRVFTLGSTGLVNCLEFATGKVIWARDVVKAVDGRIPDWGAASSPLIVDDLVIVYGGERGTHSLVALRVSDGEVAWKGGKEPSYATPVLATLAGVPQILAFHDKRIAGHDVKTGATLWQRPWGNGNVACASPVVVGDDGVLFSSGYGNGALLDFDDVGHVQLDELAVERLRCRRDPGHDEFGEDGDHVAVLSIAVEGAHMPSPTLIEIERGHLESRPPQPRCRFQRRPGQVS